MFLFAFWNKLDYIGTNWNEYWYFIGKKLCWHFADKTAS